MLLRRQPVKHKNLSRSGGKSATWLFEWGSVVVLMAARWLPQVVTLGGTMISRTGVMSGGLNHDIESRARRWDEKGLQALKKASLHSRNRSAIMSVAGPEACLNHQSASQLSSIRFVCGRATKPGEPWALCEPASWQLIRLPQPMPVCFATVARHDFAQKQ